MVALLLAVVAMVVTPHFADFLARRQLETACRQAVETVAFARDWAREHGQAVLVTWDTGSVTLSVQSPEDGEFIPLTGSPEAHLRLPEQVSVAWLEQGEEEPELPFAAAIYPDGRADDLAVNLEDEAGHVRRLEWRGNLGVVSLVPEDQVRREDVE